MRITGGLQPRPVKLVLYGTEGIGKSTFASGAPDPVFIDTEGSTAHLDVRRFDAPSSWTMLMQQVQFVIDTKPCKTLVIDTIDWAERMCTDHVISINNWKSIETLGYGKGYKIMSEEFARLINKLSDVIEAGIHVILLAHSVINKFEQPDEMGAYDRYELKLDKRCAPMVKEWADALLFANYKTIVVKSDKTKTNKAQGGQRVMYTTHHPAWDAKNRHGLPEQLPLEFASVAHIFDASITPATQPEEEWKPDISVEIKNIQSAEQAVQFVEATRPVWDNNSAPKEEAPPEPPPHPESKLPKALLDLLQAAGHSVEDLEKACGPSNDGGFGYYPAGTKATDYPEDFVNYVISDWEQFEEQIRSNKLPFDL
jgi:hypothetical protein